MLWLAAGAAQAEPASPGERLVLGSAGSVNGISADGRVIVGHSPPYVCPGFCPVPPPVFEPRYTALVWSDGSDLPVALPFINGDARQSSAANGVSADGRTIVGNTALFTSFSPYPEVTGAAAWFEGGGTPVDLTREGWTHSVAHKVSADGTVIGGTHTLAGPSRTPLATLWVNRGQRVQVLPLPGGPDRLFESDVTAISADGSTVVGVATAVTGRRSALVWTDRGTVVRRLSAPDDRAAHAQVISGRGEVIGGWMAHETLRSRAVAWFDGALVATPLGPDPGRSGWVADVSADGQVLVGTILRADGTARAVTWRDRGATETELAAPADAQSLAHAASDSGEVIVGQIGDRAAVWLGPDGPAFDLGTPEAASSAAVDVSADGRVIIGRMLSPGYRTEIESFFVYTLADGLQDHAQLVGSFRLANDTAVAAAQMQQQLAGLLAATCSVAPGQTRCIGVTGSLLSAASDPGLDLGAQDQSGVTLSAGHRAGNAVTLGLALAIGSADLSGSAFETDRSQGLAVWADWDQGSGSGLGWGASAAAGWSVASQQITRGRGLDGVAPSSGDADMSVFGLAADVGYGFDAGGGLTIAPGAGVTWLGTTRDPYSETGAGLAGSYDRMDQDVTYATVGLAAAGPVGTDLALAVDAGVDVDLDATGVTVGGTTTVPGLPAFTDGATLARNRLRPFLTATLARRFGDGSALRIGAGLATPIYGEGPQWSGSIGYTISF